MPAVLPSTVVATAPLPAPVVQADRLVALGIHEVAGTTGPDLREAASRLPSGALLVVAPDRAPVSALAPLLALDGRPGFVVADMTDVDAFGPVVDVPDGPAYGVLGPDRGDALADWSPDEALPAITVAGRTPLTLAEGVHWLLQCPGELERNRCFMSIGSRLRKPGGRLDARTPALWISNGTGRDGSERRGAPKVGWCWAGNRHTWLGFASAEARVAV